MYIDGIRLPVGSEIKDTVLKPEDRYNTLPLTVVNGKFIELLIQDGAYEPGVYEGIADMWVLQPDTLQERIVEAAQALELDFTVKADLSYVNSALALKADLNYVDDELLLKADASAVSSALALKADLTYVNTQLADKADAVDVINELADKADLIYVNAELAGKASTTDLTNGLALKANTSDVTNSLALKANTSDVTNSLALKADITYVDAELSGKANNEDVTALTAVATISANGLMSAADKTKLDGVQAGANNYSLPVATTTTLGGVKDGAGLSIAGDGTISAAVLSVAGRAGDITLDKIDVGLGNVENKSSATIRDEITGTNVTTALGFTPENSANKNQALGYVGLGADGKIALTYLPATAITSVTVVTSEAQMLALSVQVGDVAIRSDISTSFILRGNDPSVLADWQEILTPAGLVQSVNGMQGVVTITDIAGNAGTATALQTARTITLTGDASGSTSFDGTSNVSITVVVADNSHNHNQIINGTSEVTVSSDIVTKVNGTTVQTISSGHVSIAGDLSVNDPNPVLSINKSSINANSAYLQFMEDTELKALIGIGGQVDDLVTGSTKNDLCIRVTSGDIFLSTNNGTNATAILGAGGQLSLGTTNQTYKVNLADGANTGFIDFISGGLLVGSAGQLAFNTNGAERIRVDTSGQVGINTISPQSTLHVDGTILASNGTGISYINLLGQNSDGQAQIQFKNNLNSAVNAKIVAYTNSLALETNSAERVRVDSSGQVGIGTTSPGSMLHIVKDSIVTNSPIQVMNVQSSTSGTAANGIGARQAFTTEQVDGSPVVVAYIDGVLTDVTDIDSALLFSTRDTGGAVAERMRISSLGRVSIGNVDPQHRLVVGSVTDGTQYIQINTSSGSVGGVLFTDEGANAGAILYDHNSNTLSLRSNEIAELFINSGNVGIGISSPGAKLEVLGTVRVNNSSNGVLEFYSAATNRGIISQNSLNNVNGGTFISNNLTPGLAQANAAYKSWFMDLGGTYADASNRPAASSDKLTIGRVAAGATLLTGVDFLVIDNTGNTGLGTSSPGSRLHVVDDNQVVTYFQSSAGAVYLRFGNSNFTAGYIGYEEDDSLVFQTNAVERVRIDVNGYVGIGTDDPQVRLDVRQAGQTQIRAYNTTDGSDIRLIADTDHGALSVDNVGMPLLFKTEGVEKVRITSTGNVGIGRIPDSAIRLDIQAATCVQRLTSTTGINSAYTIYNNSGGNFYVGANNNGTSLVSTNTGYAGVISHSGAYPIILGTNGVERVRVDPNGAVGIGTSNPLSKLHVYGPAGTTMLVESTGNTDGSIRSKNTLGDYSLGVTGAATGYWYIHDNVNAHLIHQYIPGAGGYQHFFVNGGEQARLTATGLGINTTPSVRLHAKSNGEIARLETTVARGSGDNYLQFNDPTGAKGYIGYGSNLSDMFYINNQLNAGILFATNGTERVRIDELGRVGINVAPSESATSTRLLIKGMGATSATNSVAILNSDGNVISVFRDDRRVGIGTDLPDALLDVTIPYAKTDITARQVAMLGKSNDSSTYFALNMSMIGGATAAVRRYRMQTIEQTVANTGWLELQPHGGSVTLAASGAGGRVLIGGLTDDTSTTLQVTGNATIYGTSHTLEGSSVNGVTSYVRNNENSDYCTWHVCGTNGFSVPGWVDRAVLEAVTGNGLVIGAYSGQIVFQTNARTEVARFDTSGNFGIGLDSPDSALHVRKDSATTNAAIQVANFQVTSSGTAANGIASRIAFTVERANGASATAAYIDGILTDATAVSSALAFFTRTNAGSVTEKVRITDVGNVLIGTASDDTNKLQVNGSIRQAVTTSNVSHYISSSAGQFRDIDFQTGTTSRWRIRVDSTAESGGNAGSDLAILSRDDTGASLNASVLFLKRSTGNVLVGTTTDSGRKFQVYGAGEFKDASGIATTVWSEAVTGAGGVGTNSNHPFAIVTNGSYRMYFNTSGNVGIGTDSPGYQLDLGGGTTVNSRLRLRRGSDDANQHLTLGWDRIESLRADTPIASAQNALSFIQTGSDGSRTNLYIDTTGRVGIGNTSPASPLHVSGFASIDTTGDTGKWVFRIMDTTTSAQGVGGGILFQGYKSTGGAIGTFGGIAGIKENATNNNEQSALVFYSTPSSGVMAERARIDSIGNFGIGIVPNYKLDVAGLVNSSNGYRTNPASSPVTTFAADTNGGYIDVAGSNPFDIYTNGTSKLKVEAAGNVGVLSGNFYIRSPEVSTLLEIRNSSNVAQGYVGVVSTATNIFSTSAANDLTVRSEGSNILFGFSTTERMRLTNSGSLGVGVNPGSKFHLVSTNSGEFAAQIIHNGTTGAHGLYVNIGAGATGYPLGIAVAGSEVLRVANTGVLSVTSSADTPVTITSSAGGSYIRFINSADNLVFIGSNGDKLSFHTNGTERVTVHDNGNVGIGAPEYTKLTVGGTITATDDTTARAYLTAGSTTISLIGRNQLDSGYVSAIYDSIQHIFKCNGTEAARVSSGNLGVGTDNPTNKLHVKASGNMFRLETTTARGSGSNYLNFADPTGSKGYIGYASGSSDAFYLINEMNAPMQFGVNSAENMRISSGGNVLVGLSTDLTGDKLQVNGAIVNSNTGVDGTFSTSFMTLYSVNNVERNSIASSVSSVAVNSGWSFLVSNGGGSSATTEAVRMTRGGTYVRQNLSHEGAIADKSYELYVPTTGFSKTCANNKSALLLNPSGVLLSGTVTMCSAPIDGQIQRISTTNTITSLTISPNSGQTVAGATSLTLTASAPISYIYQASNAIWFRI
jgi:hypothetical protein